LGCARAEVVRALLISHGVDPRRIVATCMAPQGVLEASTAGVAGSPAGEPAIAILPQDGSAWAPTIGETIGQAIAPAAAAR
ncbi:MAG: hypothetical protein ACREJ0_17705, partial [Geminicoccaceae bacterium]